MREIKFRSWIRCGEWEEPDEEQQKYEMCYDLAFEEFEPINNLLKNVENLMQYTGLKDKNGKEIYEGDIILNHNYDTKGEVKWVDGNAEYICYHASGWFKFTDEYEVEVIGNMYENPELLGGERCNK